MASLVRPFKVFHYGRLVGTIRAAKPETVFSRAKKEYPHIPSAELDLLDPSVIRKSSYEARVRHRGPIVVVGRISLRDYYNKAA